MTRNALLLLALSIFLVTCAQQSPQPDKTGAPDVVQKKLDRKHHRGLSIVQLDQILDKVGVTGFQREQLQAARQWMRDEGRAFGQGRWAAHREFTAELRSDHPNQWWMREMVDDAFETLRDFIHDRIDIMIDIRRTVSADQWANLVTEVKRHFRQRYKERRQVKKARWAELLTAQVEPGHPWNLDTALDDIGATHKQRARLIAARDEFFAGALSLVDSFRDAKDLFLTTFAQDEIDSHELHHEVDDRLDDLKIFLMAKLDTLIGVRDVLTQEQWEGLEDWVRGFCSKH